MGHPSFVLDVFKVRVKVFDEARSCSCLATGEEKERKSSGTEALIRDIVTIEINSNHANEERGKNF